jgi:hypothetical protein
LIFVATTTASGEFNQTLRKIRQTSSTPHLLSSTSAFDINGLALLACDLRYSDHNH